MLTEFIRKHREGILYIICGAGTVVVSWATYALFVWFGVNPSISNALSWICAVLFAFVVNKWIVFMSHSTEKGVLIKEIGSFFVSRLATGVVEIVLFPILLSIGLDQALFGTEGFVAKIIVSIIVIILNYILSKFIVFRKSGNSV